MRALNWLIPILSALVVAAIMAGSTINTRLVLHVGEVAPRDILAPYDFTYQSKVLTEKKREAAARAVAKIYSPPDAAIARRQLARLKAACAFITAIRADPYATTRQKMKDLTAVQGLHLSAEEARYLLTIDSKRWEQIQKEAERVLETMMRSPIREDQLEEARRNIPAFIDLSLSDRQAEIVQRLVEAFLAPNSLYSAELTEAARERARESVKPVKRTFRRGETIVQRGQVLTDADIEALREYGLLRTTTSWKLWLAPILLALAAWASLSLYLSLRRSDLWNTHRPTLVLCTAFAIFLLGIRLTVTNGTLLPYFYPLPAFTLTLFLLFDAEIALAFSIPLIGLGVYGSATAFELSLYFALAGLIGIALLGKSQRLHSFIITGAGMTLTQMAVLLAIRLPLPSTDLGTMVGLFGSSVANGAASAATALVLHYLLAPYLGKVTVLQLLELSRPDQPLLQMLLREAPGTYQHSLQVANLAEQAAEAIGADALLARVGALYHDIGKVTRPHFFIENHPPGSTSPHEALDPRESARIIIGHVYEGLRLAEEYHLPKRIRDFIAEHHGTMITRFQYALALKQAKEGEKVDPADFRYPGPRPQSKETAIVMLADGCEARARAEHPKNDAELHALVHDTIEDRVKQGQLTDSGLTLRDLITIEDVLVSALRSLYHPRIKYPSFKQEQKTIPLSALQPAQDEGENEANSH